MRKTFQNYYILLQEKNMLDTKRENKKYLHIPQTQLFSFLLIFMTLVPNLFVPQDCNCSHVSTVALGVSVGPLGYTGSDWNILTAFGWIARIHLHGSQKMNPVDFIEALPFLVCCHEVEILGQEWNVFTPIARSAIAFGKTIHDPFRMNCHNFGDHLHISSSAIVRQTFWLTSTLWPNHYYK